MKTFTKIGLSTATAALLASCSSTAQNTPTQTPTTPAIYVWESDAQGFNTKSFFYDNGNEVIAFDTQFTPTLAKMSLEYLRTKTRNPISFVVISHPNPDKFNGMSVFQAEGAKVIASTKTASALEEVHNYKKYFFVKMAKMFTDENYPALSKIDETFESRLDLRLSNGELIHLQENGIPGVSSNQTVVHIPRLNALMVGDLVHHQVHAWLEGGIVNAKATPEIASWIKNLQSLEEDYPADTLVYGGRGQAAKLNVAVPAQTKYLKKADQMVSAYVAALTNNGAELLGDKAQEHYGKLTQEFERAFPTYSHSYMIQYGVYGLAQSKVK